MTLQRYGSINLRDQSSLQLSDSSSAHFIAFRAPSSVAASLTFQVPGTDLTNGVMVSDGSQNLSLALLVNANISGSAAIAYSKLNLTGSIVNADINASAAIVYSKLSLSNSIVNADINTAAAIAYSKLALSNSIVNADINTAAAIAYSKLNLSASIVNADIAAGAAIAYSKLNLSASIVNADIAAGAAISVSKLAAGSNGQVLETVAGVPTWSSVTLVSSFKSNWITADGTTKTVTHSLGSTDVIAQVFDKTDGSTIEVDSVVRTDANTLTLTASSAPGAAGWRVLILAI